MRALPHYYGMEIHNFNPNSIAQAAIFVAVYEGRKRQAEVPALAPRKSLKVSMGSTAQRVVEAQAAIQRGVASARADPKELVAQGEATEAATERVGEETPTPHEAEARESDGVEAPSVAEATEGETEAPRTSETEAMEAGAPRTTEAEVAGTGDPKTTEAGVAGAGVSAAKSAAQEVEMEAGQATISPPVQGPPPLQESAQEVVVHSISSDDTSRGKEVADAKAAGTVEQPAPTSSEGSLALVRELKAQSLRKSLFLRRERDIWDQLRQQKDLLANANELLSARSADMEDLRLRCADMNAEVATAREQAAPLVARIKELEEELTRVAGDRDTFRSRAEEATTSEAARGGAGLAPVDERAGEGGFPGGRGLSGRGPAQEGESQGLLGQGLEREISQAAEASIAVQAVLEAEIGEHNALQNAARTVCKALEVEGVESGSSLRSRLTALSGQARERLRGALHTGVKRALAVIASHYAGVDLKAVSDGYVLAEDDEEADEEVTKLMEAAEGPGTVLAKLFEEEVVPPTPSTDAGDPEP
ncbi:basal body protein 10-like [Miscanthus floridulus]|uniref:basal body protein 10-like n=1 Tax=Miscanthus floridulus TaxID=154761 RepID=UPI0034577059